MANRKNFLVIGLGRFGSSTALSLAEAGHEVMGVDIDEPLVQRVSSQLAQVAQVDAANEAALASLGVADYDGVVVGIGTQFEASILITLLLKKLGARHVVAKADTEQQADVLTRVGADLVVQPEREAGRRLARRLISPNLLDFLTVETGMTVAELRAPDWMTGKTLGELDVRRRHKINILLIKNGPRLLISPDPDDPIEAGDILVVLGSDADIARLRE